ncbi:SUKH-3 domain-containing protein [Lysinibacillus xylanilyticus]|uniref:SUKH-3 domain-containing protein n=1 Tax=Lysinibacillus xylanilyticus TaxID=582475 RepID=UPI002B23F0A2|nr:SUKH-3 domain-containing protein [Lysinibacillus xylanilyticus]MEB2282579.1 SUKH-3 domain-containing protein [Lysinibacillus xylanilyticus]
MIKKSEITKQILTNSGWYPGRKIDIKRTVDFLESKGYKLFPCVVDMLSEFGGLNCSFTRPNGDRDSFYIVPEEAYGDYYEKEDFIEIELRINEQIIAIGEARDSNMIMFMSESGKVFGEMGYCLVKFGDDIFDALETLCLVLPGEEIK